MCHHCFIIPKRALEKLEKENKVKLTTKDLSEKFRKKRSIASLRARRIERLLAGNGDRWVYDSQHSEEQRVNLVRKEAQRAIRDKDANAVYDHAGIIRKYFREELGWHSMDDKGMDLVFNVHLSLNYNNAFWDGDDMSFGDGDGTYFTGFARAIDVTAHELMHGVVQYTAALEYSGQPGALNEHYADVFGTVIKQHYKKQNEHTGDWLLGDEIMGPALKGRAIRSMKKPDDSNIPLDPQPADMRDYYRGEEDNHGVHINSGIPNKAFYLVARQIGTFSAGKLWFEALKKLHSTSGFIDLYNALHASIAIPNAVEIPATASGAVNDAFVQVGIITIAHEVVL